MFGGTMISQQMQNSLNNDKQQQQMQQQMKVQQQHVMLQVGTKCDSMTEDSTDDDGIVASPYKFCITKH